MQLDFYSSIIALIATYSIYRHKKWAWYIYILAIIINIKFYLSLNVKSLVYLEIYYLIIVLIGLIKWNKNDNNRFMLINLLFFSSCIIIFSKITLNSTNIEIFISTTGVIAQVLLAYKKVSNWLFWIISDFALIILMLENKAIWHVALYSIYLIIAFKGYLTWSKNGSSFSPKWKDTRRKLVKS
jgi:nicotinamide mononucleotide transporter